MHHVRGLLVDWWLPAALLVVAVAEVAGDYVTTDASNTSVLAAIVPLVALTGRRRHEPVFVAIAAALLTAVFIFGVQDDPGDQAPLTGFLAILVINFSLGLRGRSVQGTILVAAIQGAVQVGAALGGQSLADVIPSTLFLSGAWVIGRLFRRNRDELIAQREHAARIEAERESHAAAAAAAERSRIARELHDVVAHSLSLMVVQASVEARIHGDSSAATTLQSIEHQGRTALVELRRLLGLLREDDADLSPLPRLADLDTLLDRLRDAGHTVESKVLGDMRVLPPGVELAAYRVLQESLTNVAKHAPGADVQVEVQYLPGEIRVAVANGPSQAPPALVLEPGAGIQGMRERVRVYGGTLRTAATSGGGFGVVASIPEETA